MSDIEKDIKMLEESIQEAYRSYDHDLDYSPFSKGIAKVIERVLAERKQDKARIKELDTDLTTVYMKGYADAEEKYREKVRDVLTEIQEEYNKVQEQFDCIWNKKSKNNYDRYKLQEFSTMQQQLGFFIGKLEELLEDK